MDTVTLSKQHFKAGVIPHLGPHDLFAQLNLC